MTGVLNLDKPAGLSSARAVARVKWLLPRGTKVGHAGTLDPFATGVLLVLVGTATKRCEELMGRPKRYRATIKLGATTETLDPESPEVPTPAGAGPVARDLVAAALTGFVGEIAQRPPAFSAMKVNGRRAYDLARRGETVVLAPRPVTVYAVDLVAYDWPLATIDLHCGRGTYVRAIARDLGEALGVGGYLTALRRTAVGDFDDASAATLDDLRTLDDVLARLATPT